MHCTESTKSTNQIFHHFQHNHRVCRPVSHFKSFPDFFPAELSRKHSVQPSPGVESHHGGDQPWGELQLVPLIETDRLEADPFRFVFLGEEMAPLWPVPPFFLRGDI